MEHAPRHQDPSLAEAVRAAGALLGGAGEGAAQTELRPLPGRQAGRLIASQNLAQKVGLHLVNYLQSFPADDHNPDHVTVSLSKLEQWYQRFAAKLEKDPFFLYKTE